MRSWLENTWRYATVAKAQLTLPGVIKRDSGSSVHFDKDLLVWRLSGALRAQRRSPTDKRRRRVALPLAASPHSIGSDATQRRLGKRPGRSSFIDRKETGSLSEWESRNISTTFQFSKGAKPQKYLSHLNAFVFNTFSDVASRNICGKINSSAASRLA